MSNGYWSKSKALFDTLLYTILLVLSSCSSKQSPTFINPSKDFDNSIIKSFDHNLLVKGKMKITRTEDTNSFSIEAEINDSNLRMDFFDPFQSVAGSLYVDSDKLYFIDYSEERVDKYINSPYGQRKLLGAELNNDEMLMLFLGRFIGDPSEDWEFEVGENGLLKKAVNQSKNLIILYEKYYLVNEVFFPKQFNLKDDDGTSIVFYASSHLIYERASFSFPELSEDFIYMDHPDY